MKTYVFPIELEAEEDGRWSATVPVLPGCATWGHSQDEALRSLQEAVKAYLEVLIEEQGALPPAIEEKATVIPSSAIAVTV